MLFTITTMMRRTGTSAFTRSDLARALRRRGVVAVLLHQSSVSHE